MLHSALFHIKRLDWKLTLAALLLTGLGLLSLASSSLGKGDFAFFEKQLLFLGVGFLLMFAISFLDWRLLRNDPFFILFLYILGVLALLGLLVFAPTIRGVQGWYRVGPFSVDPIEYLKPVLIVLMARFFAFRHAEMYKFRYIILSGLYFALPLLLIFLQPDLGSAMLLAVLWGVLLLVAGIKPRHFFALSMLALVIGVLGWNAVLQDYQKERLFAFVEPELDPLGIGWSQLQSRIAIGNGGLLGQGYGEGSQTQQGFLSEPQTDFIFAAIAEEFGFLGVAALFALLIFFLNRVLRIALAAGGNFSRLFATGFATLVILQAAVNIGMNLGFLPIVGLPLPFVSYGGSSLIMSYAALGVLQSIRTH